MMIVQSRRTWIIAKLTLFVLVFLGFWIILFESKTYACPEWTVNIGNDGDNEICISKEEYNNVEEDWIKRKKCKETYGENYCNCKYILKWIYLNTEVPFIGPKDNPRCLVMSTAWAAPVNVLRAMTKILMTFVMIGGFGMIVWSWVLIASSWDNAKRYDQWMWYLQAVAIAFALLGSLWVILRFINPNFFS